MSKLFWINGQIVSESSAFISCQDLGLTRGYGVFDFLRTYEKTPFYLKEHLDRFFYSAKEIDLIPPLTRDQIEKAIDDLIHTHPHENLGIKLFLTGGESIDGFFTTHSPSFWIMAFPLSINPSLTVKLKTIEASRELPTIKSLNYLQSSLFAKRYKSLGFDDIIYQNKEGYLTESSTSNLFFIKNGTLITAEKEILFGITRQVVLQIASAYLPIENRPLHLSELDQVDECFITSTTKEICPVIRINDTLFNPQENSWISILKAAFSSHQKDHVRTLLSLKS